MFHLTRKLMMIATSAAALAGTGGGAALAATPAPAAAAGAAHTRVVALNCRGAPQIRPRSFVLTCADDNSHLTGLSWSG